MRRWLVMLAITDDGKTNEPDQQEPVHLLNTIADLRKQLKDIGKHLPGGIQIHHLWMEETIP